MIEIPLRARSGSLRGIALVDDIDGVLADSRWFLHGSGYVGRVLQKDRIRSSLLLHREVLGLKQGDGKEVDHKNGNPLDCRRSNLRVVTHLQNTQNVRSRGGTSRYRGVYWDPSQQKWRVQIKSNGHVYRLGRFTDEHEAGRVASEFRLQVLTHTNEERNAL